MKIRNGFVSNSSSSSFVVGFRRHEWEGSKCKPKVLLTKEQIKKLKKFGFRYTNSNNPYFINTTITPYEKSVKCFKKYDNINLGYDVICNQNEVIFFLIENRIPFVALCHYDEELVVWDGKTEYFYEMSNIIEKVSKENGEANHDVGETSQYFPAQLCPTIKKYKIDNWLKKERINVK